MLLGLVAAVLIGLLVAAELIGLVVAAEENFDLQISS